MDFAVNSGWFLLDGTHLGCLEQLWQAILENLYVQEKSNLQKMLEIRNNDIELFEMIMISFNYQDPTEYLLIER